MSFRLLSQVRKGSTERDILRTIRIKRGICHGFLDIKIDLPWFIFYDVHHPRGVKNEEQMEDGVFGFKFNEIGTSEFQTKDFGTKKKSLREQFGLLERTQRRIF